MNHHEGEKLPRGLMRASLTPREREVLGHLLRGATNKDIAADLGRSLKTVELHVSRVLKKLGLPTRIQLLAAMLSTEPHSQTLLRKVSDEVEEKKSSA